ncbi:hypothetical protein DIPPA_09997, partial [Diplonema papillatum]
HGDPIILDIVEERDDFYRLADGTGWIPPYKHQGPGFCRLVDQPTFSFRRVESTYIADGHVLLGLKDKFKKQPRPAPPDNRAAKLPRAPRSPTTPIAPGSRPVGFSALQTTSPVGTPRTTPGQSPKGSPVGRPEVGESGKLGQPVPLARFVTDEALATTVPQGPGNGDDRDDEDGGGGGDTENAARTALLDLSSSLRQATRGVVGRAAWVDLSWQERLEAAKEFNTRGTCSAVARKDSTRRGSGPAVVVADFVGSAAAAADDQSRRAVAERRRASVDHIESQLRSIVSGSPLSKPADAGMAQGWSSGSPSPTADGRAPLKSNLSPRARATEPPTDHESEAASAATLGSFSPAASPQGGVVSVTFGRPVKKRETGSPGGGSSPAVRTPRSASSSVQKSVKPAKTTRHASSVRFDTGSPLCYESNAGSSLPDAATPPPPPPPAALLPAQKPVRATRKTLTATHAPPTPAFSATHARPARRATSGSHAAPAALKKVVWRFFLCGTI